MKSLETELDARALDHVGNRRALRQTKLFERNLVDTIAEIQRNRSFFLVVLRRASKQRRKFGHPSQSVRRARRPMEGVAQIYTYQSSLLGPTATI